MHITKKHPAKDALVGEATAHIETADGEPAASDAVTEPEEVEQLDLVWVPRSGYVCPHCEYKANGFGGKQAMRERLQKHIEENHGNKP